MHIEPLGRFVLQHNVVQSFVSYCLSLQARFHHVFCLVQVSTFSTSLYNLELNLTLFRSNVILLSLPFIAYAASSISDGVLLLFCYTTVNCSAHRTVVDWKGGWGRGIHKKTPAEYIL